MLCFLKKKTKLDTCLLKGEDGQISEVSIQMIGGLKCALELILATQFHVKRAIFPSNGHQPHRQNDM